MDKDTMKIIKSITESLEMNLKILGTMREQINSLGKRVLVIEEKGTKDT